MVNVDLLYAKKDGGPRMDPLGAPAIRSDHGECWPLKNTLAFMLVKKSVKRDKSHPKNHNNF